MSNVGKIRLRCLSEITEHSGEVTRNGEMQSAEGGPSSSTATTTPKKVVKRQQKNTAAATTSKKRVPKTTTETSSTARTAAKKKDKELPRNQRCIDSFFKSCAKTYKVEPDKENTATLTQSTKKSISIKTKTRKQAARGRKRLFDGRDDIDTVTTTTVTSMSCLTELTPPRTQCERLTLAKRKATKTISPTTKKAKEVELTAIVDLCTDDEEVKEIAVEQQKEQEEELQLEMKLETKAELKVSCITCEVESPTKTTSPPMVCIPSHSLHVAKVAAEVTGPIDCRLPTPPSSSKSMLSTRQCRRVVTTPIVGAVKAAPTPAPTPAPTLAKRRVRKPRPCPPYKLVAGTTFAVDAFQFGSIAGVTHYFLSHFHADHYVGLTGKFAMPLYLSPVTARLVRTMIGVQAQYLHELELGVPQRIEDVQVTAIDANHCPGAVMFVFQLAGGQCLLHTGDFRACAEMESEPIFWNNWIDTIYLDTTYLSDKYDFCTQHESIDRAVALLRDFRAKHANARILYVCGGYLIGKEKFWSALAREFNLKVWTEENRRKALRAMDLNELQQLLSDDPLQAQVHVIAMAKLAYPTLVDYFSQFRAHFDVVLALRPSGWEKNSRPQFRGQINIVGIEYSEHSSHNELERFVRYLKPREVISTVPVARDLMVTCEIPQKWYKYESLSGRHRNFQPSITSYIKMRPKGVLETPNKCTSHCVTPTKSPVTTKHNLSQLSVRAMATYMGAEEQQQAPKSLVLDMAEDGVRVGIADADAEDDWLS